MADAHVSVQPNKNGSNDDQKVPLGSLSELTGFPIDFIKKELLLSADELSMSELRSSMITYLESTSKQIQE